MSASRPCDSYRPGHIVHPIQFFHGLRTPSRPVHLSAVVEQDSPHALVAVVHVDGGPEEAWLFHDLPGVRASLDRWRRSGARLHDLGLLIVGAPSDRTQACLYPCRKPQAWTECATLASVGSHDPVALTNALGGFLMRPTKRPARPVIDPADVPEPPTTAP